MKTPITQTSIRPPHNIHQQRGAVLAVSLIMLLLLTILGITAIQTTTMQERMAGNSRDLNMAFQAAEAALRKGEIDLTAATVPAFDGTGGHFTPAALNADEIWETIDWSTSAINYTTTLYGVAAQPQYIVEELPTIAKNTGSLEAGLAGTVQFYRITSRAVGATSNSIAMLQSVYKR